MDKWIDSNQKERSYPNCQGPDGRTYVFDFNRGIYKQEIAHSTKDDDDVKPLPKSIRFRTRKVRRKWFLLIVPNLIGIGTLVVVAIYTHYAALQVVATEGATNQFMKAQRLQAEQSREQISIARNTLTEFQREKRLDERPWLRFREFSGTAGQSTTSFNMGTGKKLQVPIEFTNFGKTVAVRIRAMVIIEVLPVGVNPHFPKERHLFVSLADEKAPKDKGFHKTSTPPYDGIESAIEYPGDTTEVAATWKQAGINGQMEDRIVTQADVDAMVHKTSYLVIWGFAQYSDIFGVDHWTRFCVVPKAYQGFQPRVEKCLRYPDVDNNDDPNVPIQ